jgi:hypothetical protein
MLTTALRSVSVILCTAAFVWGVNPVVGTWTLNPAKSTFYPGPTPKEETRVYEANGDGVKVTVTTIGADGKSTIVNISANYDGKDYPVTGSILYDAIELKRIDDQTTEGTMTHAGKVIATTHREISKDGRTMTMTFKTSTEPPITNKAVYEKQD